MDRDEANRAFHRYLAHGEPEDLARVFDLCAPQLLLFASHVAGEAGAAEDLVQLTFLRAIEGACRFEAGRPVLPWLVGILVLEARKHRRQAGRRPDPDRLPPRAEAVPLEAAELREFQETLTREIAELPPAYREVLTLRLIHGLSPTEIAHARGVSPETVKTQLRRGTERLRRRLPAGYASALALLAAVGQPLSAVRATVLQAAADAGPIASVPSASMSPSPSPSPGPLPASALPSKALPSKVLPWFAAAGLVVTVGVLVSLPADGDGPDVPQNVAETLHREEVSLPQRTAAASAGADELAEPDAPVRGLVSFEGSLVNELGLPLQGIRLELLRLHPDALLVDREPLPAWTTEPTLLAGAVESDAAGRFRIDGVLPWGTFLLIVDAGGARSQLRMLHRTPEPGERFDLGELELKARRFVRGRIVDEFGRGIEGARLRLRGEEWRDAPELGLAGLVLRHLGDEDFEADGAVVARWGSGWQALELPAWCGELFDRLILRTVTTDQNGAFEWVTTGPGRLDLVVSAPGFAPGRIGIRIPDRETDAGSFALKAGTEVHGLCVDASGRPVPGAEVMLGRRAVRAKSAVARRVGRTDPDGEFRAPWPDYEPVFAVVRTGPGEPWFVSDRIATDRRITIRVPPRHDVIVRVVDRRHRPLSHPALRLVPGDLVEGGLAGTLTMHQLGFVAPLDLDGRRTAEEPGVVRLAGVPAGSWVLIASAEGYAPSAVPLRVDGVVEQAVELAPLETTAIEIDDSGFHRLAHLPVVVRAFGERDLVHEFPVLVGRTDKDGALDVARSRWRRLAVSAASAELGWYQVAATPGIERLGLTVPARGVVTGRMTEGGVPPVFAEGWLLIAQRARARTDAAVPAIASPPVVCTPKADGSFQFAALEPGRYRVRALRTPSRLTHPSQLLPFVFPDPDGDGPSSEVEVMARGLVDLPFEALEPVEAQPDEGAGDSSTTLHGVVRSGGQPAAGLKVMIERGGAWQAFELDGDGAFDCGFAPDGPVRVAVVEGTRAADVPAQFLWSKQLAFGQGAVPAVEIDLELSPLTCTLRTAGGARASRVEVELIGDLDDGAPAGIGAESRFTVRADDAGWFECARLPAGRYALRVADPTAGWLSHELLVGKDVTTIGMSLALSPLLRVSGVARERKIGVDLPGGSKIELVRDGSAGTELRRVGLFGTRGAFEVGGLLPGRYRVTLRPIIVRIDPSGRRIVILPEQSGIAIPQGTVELHDRDLSGVVLDTKAN